jgi:hypothetical protein
MGSLFWQGFHRRKENDRRSRLDLLAEELQRGQMALRDAAETRSQARFEDERATRARLAERMGYLDRMKVLGRDTQPFGQLLGKYPGSGAAPDVTRAHELDDLLARRPEAATEQPPVSVPWAPGQQPTYGEERGRAIASAYEKFGSAAEAQRKAGDALKERLAGARGPKTTSLDIQLRGVAAKKKQAQALIAGVYMDDDGFVKQITDPEARQAAIAQGRAMLAQAEAEEARVRAGYQGAGAVPPADLGPRAMYQQLEALGLEADEIAAQLGATFSDEELRADGFEIGD